MHLAFASLAVFFDFSAVSAADQMTVKQARVLAVRAVQQYGQPIILDAFDGGDVSFYFFEQLNPNPRTSVHVRFVAVNRETGDVWGADGICEHLLPKMTAKQIAKLKPPRSKTPQLCEKE